MFVQPMEMVPFDVMLNLPHSVNFFAVPLSCSDGTKSWIYVYKIFAEIVGHFHLLMCCCLPICQK